MRRRITTAGLALVVALLPAMTAAQSTASWSYRSDTSERRTLVPYIFAAGGYGLPSDPAYREAFNRPYPRFGGGFGLRFGGLGAEALVRFGEVDQVHTVTLASGESEARKLSLGSREAQLRFYGVPSAGKLRLPVGLLAGMVRLDADRGYPDERTRFQGTGFYAGPFLGVEMPVMRGLRVALDLEYSMGMVEFPESTTFASSTGAGEPTWTPTTTGTGFWDTVGGWDRESFEHGGFSVTLRAVVTLPRL